MNSNTNRVRQARHNNIKYTLNDSWNKIPIAWFINIKWQHSSSGLHPLLSDVLFFTSLIVAHHNSKAYSPCHRQSNFASMQFSLKTNGTLRCLMCLSVSALSACAFVDFHIFIKCIISTAIRLLLYCAFFPLLVVHKVLYTFWLTHTLT